MHVEFLFLFKPRIIYMTQTAYFYADKKVYALSNKHWKPQSLMENIFFNVLVIMCSKLNEAFREEYESYYVFQKRKKKTLI